VSGVEPGDQDLQGGHCLGGGEQAVAGSVHGRLPDEIAVNVASGQQLVGALFRGRDEPVVGGVQGQHGYPDAAGEGHIAAQVVNRGLLGRYPRRAEQRVQIVGESQPAWADVETWPVSTPTQS